MDFWQVGTKGPIEKSRQLTKIGAVTKGAEGPIAHRLAAVRAELEDLCRIRFLTQLLPYERRRYEELCAEERRLLASNRAASEIYGAATDGPLDLTDTPPYTRAHRLVRPLTSRRGVAVRSCSPKD